MSSTNKDSGSNRTLISMDANFKLKPKAPVAADSNPSPAISRMGPGSRKNTLEDNWRSWDLQKYAMAAELGYASEGKLIDGACDERKEMDSID
ncbi:hypothetical protein B0H16DRAFT_1749440 [Mycena metata]|uniref:Uncharacterized protein n=1 Tax=Mycena metata TaxID=1033252 RepID=A0AAD7DW78_9AGAR|nr:hypothetical protein B0H16DRAFT_1749440 [Mycena metata]